MGMKAWPSLKPLYGVSILWGEQSPKKLHKRQRCRECPKPWVSRSLHGGSYSSVLLEGCLWLGVVCFPGT